MNWYFQKDVESLVSNIFKHAALKALGTDQMPHIPFKKPMVKSLLSVRAGFPGAWIVFTPDTQWIPAHSERRSRTGTFNTCTCSSQVGSGRSNAPSLRGMLVAIDLEIFRSKQTAKNTSLPRLMERDYMTMCI